MQELISHTSATDADVIRPTLLLLQISYSTDKDFANLPWDTTYASLSDCDEGPV